MTSIFNSFNTLSNTSPVQSQMKTVSKSIPVVASTPTLKNVPDEVNVNVTNKKTSLFGKINSTISNVKQSFVSFGEHTKGFFKGLTNGFAAGSMMYTAGKIINALEKNSGKKPLPVKFMGIAAGIISFGINYWQGHLNANEKMSDIQHRWTGHQ